VRMRSCGTCSVTAVSQRSPKSGEDRAGSWCDGLDAQGWRRGHYCCVTPWTRSRSQAGPCPSHHGAAGFCKKLPRLRGARSWEVLPILPGCQRRAATSPDPASIPCATGPHRSRNIVLPTSGYQLARWPLCPRCTLASSGAHTNPR